MTKMNLNIELIEKIIDAWESVSDINQYRDTFETKKEEKELYKKVLKEVLVKELKEKNGK